MQDLIKRYFWVLGALVVMVCAVFAAKATSHVVEAKFLGDPEHGAEGRARSRRARRRRSSRRAARTARQLAPRNMFCSDCTPAVETASNVDPSSIATTSLPLALLATNVGARRRASRTRRSSTPRTSSQGAYSIGDKIPGASRQAQRRSTTSTSTSRTTATSSGSCSPARRAPPRRSRRSRRPPATARATRCRPRSTAASRRSTTTTTRSTSRSSTRCSRTRWRVAKGARVVPAVKNGKPDGFKLYAIRPSSVYAKLGLQNGDTLQSINGFELTSADKALEVYTKLREATSLAGRGHAPRQARHAQVHDPVKS